MKILVVGNMGGNYVFFGKLYNFLCIIRLGNARIKTKGKFSNVNIKNHYIQYLFDFAKDSKI